LSLEERTDPDERLGRNVGHRGSPNSPLRIEGNADADGSVLRRHPKEDGRADEPLLRVAPDVDLATLVGRAPTGRALHRSTVFAAPGHPLLEEPDGAREALAQELPLLVRDPSMSSKYSTRTVAAQRVPSR
jgi:hypothetical protein